MPAADGVPAAAAENPSPDEVAAKAARLREMRNGTYFRAGSPYASAQTAPPPCAHPVPQQVYRQPTPRPTPQQTASAPQTPPANGYVPGAVQRGVAEGQLQPVYHAPQQSSKKPPERPVPAERQPSLRGVFPDDELDAPVKKKKSHVGLAVILIVLALIAALAYLALFPRAKSGVSFPASGISVKSLCGGNDLSSDGGVFPLLISGAVTRGRAADKADYPQTLAALTVSGKGGDAAFTLLRDPVSGALAAEDVNGNVRKLFSKYVGLVLSYAGFDEAFPLAVPGAITVDTTEIPVYEYDTEMPNLAGKLIRASGGDKGDYSLKYKSDSAPAVSGASSGNVTVTDMNGATVFSGGLDTLSQFKAAENGPLLFTLEPQAGVIYKFTVDFQFKTEVSVSSLSVAQGDSFVVTVTNAPDDVFAELELEYAPVFDRIGDTAWTYIPVGYRQTPGDYGLSVKAGELTQDFTLTVTKSTYPEESFRMKASVASSSTGSDAYEIYKKEFLPLYYSYEPDVYWSGTFIQPVSEDAEGYWISSEFGVIRRITYYGDDGKDRYTNVSYHAGVDFACAEGTPIVAPNAGKVIYSGYLEYMVGNAIIIDHGNGLHSMFYHMSARSVEKGDIVEQGQQIGAVGTTGYSTGPHLHYSMMIGDYNINPFTAFDGTAGFYSMPRDDDDAA